MQIEYEKKKKQEVYWDDIKIGEIFYEVNKKHTSIKVSSTEYFCFNMDCNTINNDFKNHRHNPMNIVNAKLVIKE